MTLTAVDRRPALIVIDLQKGLADARTVHPLAEIVDRSATLAAAFRRHGLPVVLVTAAGRPPGRTDTGSASRRRAVGTADWTKLVDELQPQAGDHRLTKYTAGAFHRTGLDDYLRDHDVTQVVITGISTSMGVESTARAAYEHGYHVVLATDAMTDLSVEAHANSVERIFPRIGETTTSGEFVEMLDSSH